MFLIFPLMIVLIQDINFKRIRIRKLLNNLKKEGLDEEKFNITLQIYQIVNKLLTIM